MSIPGGGLLSPKEVMGFPCSYLRDSVSLEVLQLLLQSGDCLNDSREGGV